MFEREKLEEIARRRSEWEQGPLLKLLERFEVNESPNRFYTLWFPMQDSCHKLMVSTREE